MSAVGSAGGSALAGQRLAGRAPPLLVQPLRPERYRGRGRAPPVPREMAYQPGRGISGEALERLRARKQAEAGIADVPAEDQSDQWDRLLGTGAKKKLRCGVCTRPLSEEEQAHWVSASARAQLRTSAHDRSPAGKGRVAISQSEPQATVLPPGQARIAPCRLCRCSSKFAPSSQRSPMRERQFRNICTCLRGFWAYIAQLRALVVALSRRRSSVMEGGGIRVIRHPPLPSSSVASASSCDNDEHK